MLTVKPRLIRFIPVLLLGLLVGAGCACAQSITFQFVGTEYRDVFQTIGEIAGLNVLVDASVSVTGSFNFRMLREQALKSYSSAALSISSEQHPASCRQERLAEIQATGCITHTMYIAPSSLSLFCHDDTGGEILCPE